MSENTKLWDAVCKTDPSMTKHVTLRGGFTSICAQWQVQRATEQFGPLGVGWGYDVVYSTVTAGEQVLQMADVTLWHGCRENRYGPVRGCNPLLSDKGRLDDDAPKKAMTDALTKGLSHLGFSADVFLGKFDDNKYVAAMKREFAEGNAAPPNTPPAKPDTPALVQAIADIQAAGKIDDVVKWLGNFRQKLSSDELDKLYGTAGLRIHELCRRMADELPTTEEVAARQADVMALFAGKLLWLSDKQTEINTLFETRKRALDRPTDPPA